MFGSQKLERKSEPFSGFGSFIQPGESRVGTRTEKFVRDRVQNSAINSQERHRDDNPCSTCTRKLVRSGVCERSGSTGKPV